MTPERKNEAFNSLQEDMERGSRLMLRAMYEDTKRAMYLYLGYTAEEASMWRRFNRCCHAGRRIRILERPMMMRAGKIGDNLLIRVPAMMKPSTPTDVTPA